MRCDLIIEAYMFALCHINIVCFVYRAKLRDMRINVIASVSDESSGTSPWSLQVAVCIGCPAPVIDDFNVNTIALHMLYFVVLDRIVCCMASPFVADAECDV